jgi:filamentous hemagglutinin family protein
MRRSWWGWWLGILLLLGGGRVQANPIVPANDGVGTVVNRVGNQFDITGGTRAGANLFHSLLKFGLSEQQIANFLSQPSIRNILTRVTGGETSVINGLIKVTGGNSNLYLMNPAGIVFGAGARLDIPGSFHATTANAIKVGDGWFGMNTPPSELMRLTGEPGGFAFSRMNEVLNGEIAGVIKNEGRLSVPAGERVVLAGGLVVNTGVIETAHGQVIVTASPGGRYVEVTPAGSVLSFSVPVATEEAIAVQNLRPLRWEDVVSLATGTVYVGGTVSTASGVKNPNSIINITGERVILDRANLSNVGTDGLIQIRVAPGVETQGYLFLDRVRNYEQLVNGLAPGHDLFLVNRTDSGVEKVNQVVARSGAVPRIDIVGDGNAGQIWFGRDFITLDTLPQYEAQIAQWGQGLTGNREIFLYACNLAASQAGIELVNQISELTNSSVSASRDITGHGKYGGNWQFEYSTGHGSTQNVFTAETIQNADVKLVTFTVTLTTDSAVPVAGELRFEINQANGSSGADDIVFAPATNGIPIVLNGQLNVTDPAGLTIKGNGASNTIIDGGGVDRVFNASVGNMTFEGVTIRNGNSVLGDGGGIRVANGNVTLINSLVVDNVAEAAGGGIRGNDVTLINSTVSKNTASKNGGGGIRALGNVTLTNSTVSDNTALNPFGSGGGIAANGTVSLTNSTVSGNTAQLGGGGIVNGASNVTLTNSTVSKNKALNGTGGGIATSGAVTLTNSTVSGNTTSTSGGGIRAVGDVDLNNSTVSGNTANASGGGISANGNVTLTNSTVSKNTAGKDGGGIYAISKVTLTNSTVSDNTASQDGGGIYVGGGGQISNSDITRNDAQTGSGGGIFNGSGSDLTISASKITENEASVRGGGIDNSGMLTLKDVTVAGNGQVFGVNDGGGLANEPGATATIINSTFSGNFANNGGGIDNQGTLTLTNSTIGNNEAILEGGGIRNLGGDVTLNNVTIVGNKVTLAGGQGGGGIFNAPASTVTISNSIVAGNEDLVNGATKNEVVNQGTFTISGKNLVGQNGNLGGFPANPSNIVVPGGVIGVQVGPLQNNGGLTETFALLPGSLAINASGAGATTSDQRGVAAVGVRDIGAFEFVPPVVPVVTGEVLVLTAELGRFLTQEEERLLFQPYLCVGEVLLAGAPSPELPACVQSVNVRQGGELFDLLRN